MLDTYKNMTSEEQVKFWKERAKFWKESAKYWNRECTRLSEYIDELMEEADVQETEGG